MEKNIGGCKCNLNLGIELLSQKDIISSEEFERMYKLRKQAIHFLGPCNTSEKCEIKDKIMDVKSTLSDYYFDDEELIIAIPNQISLPNKPRLLHDNDKYLDKFYEEKLHQQSIVAVRDLRSHAFLIQVPFFKANTPEVANFHQMVWD